MKKEERAKKFNDDTYHLETAKTAMIHVIEYLEEDGLVKEARQLEKLVINLEKFQNKYR